MKEQNIDERYLTISNEERWRHDALFYDYGPDAAGLLEGDRAKELFGKSNLPTSELDHIWRLADFNRDDKLDEAEFVIALHLIQHRLSGHLLPNVLPAPLRVKPCSSVKPTAASPAECLAYMKMFKYLSSNEATHLDGIKVGRVMTLSSLPIETLARIWDLSDIDHDGKLNCHEFSTAMHLLRCCAKGMPINCSVDTRTVLPKKDVHQSLKESRERLLVILTEKRALLSRKTELLRETSNENGGRDAAGERELQELNTKLIAERTKEQGVKEEIQELEKKGEARLNVHIMRVFDKTFFEKKHQYGLQLFKDIGYKPGVSGFRKDFPTDLFVEHNFVEFVKTLDVPEKRELTRKRLASERYPTRNQNSRPRPRSMAGIRAKSIGSYEEYSGSNWSVGHDTIDSASLSHTDEQIGLSDYVTVERVPNTVNPTSNGSVALLPKNNENANETQQLHGVDLGLNDKVITLPESTAVQKPFELNGRTNLPGADKQRNPIDLSAHMSSSAFYYNPDNDKKNPTNDADLRFHSIRNRSNFEQREQWFSDKESPTSVTSTEPSENVFDDQNNRPQRSPDHTFSLNRMSSTDEEVKSPKLFSPLFFDGGNDKQANRIDDSSTKRLKMQEQRNSIEEPSIQKPNTKSSEIDQTVKEEIITPLDEKTAQSLPTGSVPPFFDPSMQERSDNSENVNKPSICIKELTEPSLRNKNNGEVKEEDSFKKPSDQLLRARLDSVDGDKSEKDNKPKKKVLRKISGKKVKRPSSFVGFSRLRDNNSFKKDGLMHHSSESIRQDPMITEPSENGEKQQQIRSPTSKSHKLIEEEHIDLNARKAWLETLVRKSENENDFDKVKRRSLERKSENRERRNSLPSIQYTASMFEVERNLNDGISNRRRSNTGETLLTTDYENENVTSSKNNDITMHCGHDSSEKSKVRNDSYKSNSSQENFDNVSEEMVSVEECSDLMSAPETTIVKCDSPVEEKKGLGTNAFAERTKWLESLAKDTTNENIESTNSIDKTSFDNVEPIEKIESKQAIEPERENDEIELSVSESQSDNAEPATDNTEIDSNDLLLENKTSVEEETNDDDESTVLSIQERIKRLQAGKQNNDDTASSQDNVLLKSEPQKPQPPIINDDENKLLNQKVASSEDTLDKFTNEPSSPPVTSKHTSLTSGEVTKTTDQSRIQTSEEMKIYNIDRLDHRKRWEEKKLAREANMEPPFVSSDEKQSMSSLGESLLGATEDSESPEQVIENRNNETHTSNMFTNGHCRNENETMSNGKVATDIDYRKYVKDSRIMQEIEEQERREEEFRKQREITESVSSEATDTTTATTEYLQDFAPSIDEPRAESPSEWEEAKLKTFGQKMSIFENNNTEVKRDAVSPIGKSLKSPEVEKPPSSLIWDPRAVDDEEEVIIISKSNGNVESGRNIDDVVTRENKPASKPKHRMSVIEREQEAERLRLIEFEEERRLRNQERLRLEEAEKVRQEELQAERMLQKAKEENLRQVQLAQEKERLQKEREEKLRRQQKTLELRALFESAPTPS